MDCPNCNGEMVLGYIQSGRGMIWSIRKHKLSFLPKIKDGDVWVEGDNGFGSYKESFRCPECGTIGIPTSNGNDNV